MNTMDNTNEYKPIPKAIFDELTGAYLQRRWDRIKHPSLKQKLQFLIAIYAWAIFDADVVMVAGTFIVEYYFKWLMPNAIATIILIDLILLLAMGLTGRALIKNNKKAVK